MTPGFGSTKTSETRIEKTKPIAACIHGQSTPNGICPACLKCTKLDGVTPKCPLPNPSESCVAKNGKFTIVESSVVPGLWGHIDE